jgi:DNA polymerase-3 subunit delta'
VSGWAEIVGHERVLATLRRAADGGRPHHAYLFLGPRGVGKATVARIFARALACERPELVSPCEQCPACVRSRAGTHADLWVEVPQGAANTITVEQVAEVQRRLSFKRAEGRFRVVTFDDAWAMQPAAQNKLLKTLEEPPPATVLLLVAVHPAQLLQTVRSRCLKLLLGEVDGARILPWLRERHATTDDMASHVVAAAHGAPGRARALLAATEFDDARHQLQEAARALDGDREAAVSLAQSVDRDREGALELLARLQELLRDAMVSATGATVPLLHGVPPTEGGRIVARSAPDLARLGARIEVLRGALRRQVHPGGVVEDFLLHLEASSLGSPG